MSGMRGIRGAVLVMEREKDAECLSTSILNSSQSSRCRVSAPQCCIMGPQPWQRKARTQAELFSDADARADGKICGDHEREGNTKPPLWFFHDKVTHCTDSLAPAAGRHQRSHFSKMNSRTSQGLDL